jgi:hypothetical protein
MDKQIVEQIKRFIEQTETAEKSLKALRKTLYVEY